MVGCGGGGGGGGGGNGYIGASGAVGYSGMFSVPKDAAEEWIGVVVEPLEFATKPPGKFSENSC